MGSPLVEIRTYRFCRILMFFTTAQVYEMLKLRRMGGGLEGAPASSPQQERESFCLVIEGTTLQSGDAFQLLKLPLNWETSSASLSSPAASQGTANLHLHVRLGKMTKPGRKTERNRANGVLQLIPL